MTARLAPNPQQVLPPGRPTIVRKWRKGADVSHLANVSFWAAAVTRSTAAIGAQSGRR